MDLDHLSPEEFADIAEEAYVFSFPMLMGYRYCFGTFLLPSLPSYRGPMNMMHGDPVTLDPDFKEVITPNADTPYSMAALDLRAEPLVLDVPAVRDRYYVMQFEDLYGTNPHYVGSRTTGSDPGSYLLAGPGFTGAVPDGISDVLRFETDLVFIIGRTQLLGPDDVETLRPIMEAYHLEPLSKRLGTAAPIAPAFDWPVWDDEASRDERFISYVNALLEWCQPPHPSEVAMFERFERAGIGAGLPFDASRLDDEVRSALRAGVDRARTEIAARVEHLGDSVNGWSAVDALGSREFFDGDYLLRAAGAMAGWGGNDKVEAFYPLARTDADGEPLSGDHAYRLRFDTLPPARAFWSVTMYDTSYDGVSGYLVENKIGRYLVNSTTVGLVDGPDGSLTIHIRHDEPHTEEGRANWLPAPQGPFYLAMRLYWPEPEALDGRWQPPPLTKSVDRPGDTSTAEVRQACSRLGVRDWTLLDEPVVLLDEASAIRAELGAETLEIGIEEFRRGLEVELEHGLRFADANVTNNHPLLTGKIVLAHLKEMLDYYLRLQVAELEGDMFKALVANDPAAVAASYSRVIEAREELVHSEVQALGHRV